MSIICIFSPYQYRNTDYWADDNLAEHISLLLLLFISLYIYTYCDPRPTLFETDKLHTTKHYIMCLSAQPIFTNDNRLTQYGEFGGNVDINVNVYSIPKYTTLRWYKSDTQVSPSTKYGMSERPTIVNDTFHSKDVQLDGYSVVLTIKTLTGSDFNVSYRLQLSYGVSQSVQYTVYIWLKSASKLTLIY